MPGPPQPRRRLAPRPSSIAVPIGQGTQIPENARENSPSANPLGVFIATGAGSGYAPVASGTFGSMVGVALFFPLSALGSWLYLLVTLALLSLGVWAADEFERAFGKKDDGRIVIDEIVGQLLTLFPFVFLGISAGFLWLVTGFVVFRVFDVIKPGPVRWAEESFRGGAGVMLDDVLAGIFSALVMGALIAILG